MDSKGRARLKQKKLCFCYLKGETKQLSEWVKDLKVHKSTFRAAILSSSKKEIGIDWLGTSVLEPNQNYTWSNF